MDILLGFTQFFVSFIITMGIFTTPYGVIFVMVGIFILFTVFILIPSTLKQDDV